MKKKEIKKKSGGGDKKETKKKEIKKKVNGGQKVDPGEENSPAAPAGTRTRDLSITSPTL